MADTNPPRPGPKSEEEIRALLGDRVLQLEHIGSTSVPGLAAKPIIDMLLVVPDPEAAGYALVIRERDWA